MAYITKEELETIRLQHVEEQNKRYHSVMTKIVNDAILALDLDLLQKEFVEKIKANPEKSTVSCFYDMKLDKLFGSPYSWKATKDGKGEFISNPKPRYELWLDTPRGLIGSSNGCMKRIIFDKNEQSNNLNEAFQYYFINEDPHIQELKQVLEEAFPDAKLLLFLYNNSNEDTRLHIEIKMDLEPKIPGLIVCY